MAVGVWSSLRPGPSGSDAKPVPLELVYVLDGSFALAIAAATCRLLSADLVNPGFPPVLLVGLDYPEDRPNARTRDYTMKDSVPEYMGKLLGAGTPQTTPGGADRFLEFLESELDPFIRSKYHVKESPAGIIGTRSAGLSPSTRFCGSAGSSIDTGLEAPGYSRLRPTMSHSSSNASKPRLSIRPKCSFRAGPKRWRAGSASTKSSAEAITGL
ncbi:alpha/beta hydrolase-fold protein [Sphingopyxis fribergensis]